MLIRRLLDGERVDHDGPRYPCATRCASRDRSSRTCRSSSAAGGGARRCGPSRERADAWNNNGSLDEIRDALETLERHCAEVGRDIATIERTASFHIILRDDADAARARTAELLGRNGVDDRGLRSGVAGSPAEVADILRPYHDLGFCDVHRADAGSV